MKPIVIVGIIILGVAGIFYFRSPQNNPRSVTQTIQNQKDMPQTSVLVENLDTPWAIAFLPDTGMLVTERAGTVRLVDSNGNLQQEPVAKLSEVTEIGEGGLLGIALHPNFSSNNYVYVYYTYSSSGSNTLNRVSRLTYKDKKLTDEKIIVDKIPGASNHNGGRIKFGPDNFLYITAGDAQNPSQAQDKNTLGGKILRVTDEGKPATGNPFNSLIYSLGHRNPQGIAWDASGNLWETEHGRSAPTGLDEVNLIQAGKNYGWPTIQGGETRSGMETPKINSGEATTWAPAGAVFVNNSLFFAGLRGVTLYEAVIQGDRVIELKEHLVGQYGRLREVIAGPDGMLYITTSNRDGRGVPNSADDRIIRVSPAKL